MAEGTRGYAQRVDIRAGIDTVWQALIDPKLLSLWYAPAVRIDARQGGIYAVRLGAKRLHEAHIDVFLPPRRLRLIYMPFPGVADEGAAIVDDFLLDRDETSAITVLRLLGSGIPDNSVYNPIYQRLRKGWDRALLRLKVMLERPRNAAGAGPAGSKRAPLKRPAGS
jgi:Activator of Hsp90 ATPase homolog 1-like protein